MQMSNIEGQCTEDEAMKVLLTPEAYNRYLKQKYGNNELPEDAKQELEQQMSDPIRNSDSRVGHWLQDLWEHPEKVKWYRDHVLFPSIDEKYFPDQVEDNPHDWNVEIPILSMDF